MQAVTNNSIVVMAETDSPKDVIVHYKIKGSEQIQQEKTTFYRIAEDRRISTYVHRIKLTNLEAGEYYSYRVVDGKDTSQWFTFRTAVPEGVSFRVAIMGDSRSNPEVHSRKSVKMKTHNPDFSIYTGDLCFSGKYSEWKKEFFTPEEQNLIAEVPFFNALGNHEAGTDLTKVFLQAPESASGDEYYYSFDYGDAHFLILNTEGNIDENSPQFKFAMEDLKSTNKRWKIVVFHKPAYSFGGHKPNSKMQVFTKNIFEPNGVIFVFCGHNHFYQRCEVNGIQHFTIAGGGAPLYTPEENEYVMRSVKDYNYAIMEVSPTRLEIKAYDLRGKVIDSFSTQITIED